VGGGMFWGDVWAMMDGHWGKGGRHLLLDGHAVVGLDGPEGPLPLGPVVKALRRRLCCRPGPGGGGCAG